MTEDKMIEKVLITTHAITEKAKVVFYPRAPHEARSYTDLSIASRKRLEKAIRGRDAYLYIREHGVSVWVYR